MSEVHKAISAHSKKQHEHIKQFMRLENESEKAIDEVVAKCRRTRALYNRLQSTKLQCK